MEVEHKKILGQKDYIYVNKTKLIREFIDEDTPIYSCCVLVDLENLFS